MTSFSSRLRAVIVLCIALTSLFVSLFFEFQPVEATTDDPVILGEITSIPPEINKKFSPVSIPPGGTSRLTVEIYNPNEFALTDVTFTDQLDKIQTGIILTDDPLAVTTCGGTLTAEPGSASFSLVGGTVGAKVGSVNGSCTVSVNVTSFTPGNLHNEFIPGDLTAEYEYAAGQYINLSNTSPVLETLNVVDLTDPYVYKSFYPTTVWVGASTRVRITINNRDANYPLHDVSLEDTLPTGMVLADPVNIYIASNCGDDAVVSATPGETTFSISGATIPANTSCIFDVYAVGTTNGYFTNTIPAESLDSYEGVTNPNTPSASITVRGVWISKSIAASSILAGEDSTTMTITIYNPHTQPLTNVSIADELPGEDLVFVPGTISTTCETGEQSANLTLSDGNSILTLTNGTVPAGSVSNGSVTTGNCTITATLTAPGDAGGGYFVNRINIGDLTNDQELSNTNSTSDSITVQPQTITVYKYFVPDRFELGGQTDVVIYLYNPTSSDITGVTMTDDLPSAFVTVDPAVTATTCGGTVTVTSTSITLTGGTIPADSQCNFRATITTAPGTAAGSYSNSISAESITTDGGITNESGASDTVVVYPENLGATLYKYFNDSNAAQPTGTAIQLRLGIRAPEDQDLDEVFLTDTLPEGLVIASSPSASTSSACGTSATVTAEAGGSTIQLSNASISAGATCYTYVYVTSYQPGVYQNILYPADLTNDKDQTSPNTATDTITFSDYTISKTFSHTEITWGGQSILTITLNNGYDSALTDVFLQDRLSTMGSGEFQVAPIPDASTTCGGTLTATPDTNIITLSGGTVPANGSCSISATIIATPSARLGNNTNTISTTDSYGSYAGLSGTSSPRYSASATLRISDLSMELVKNFNPSSVAGGSSSQMTILLINPNEVPLEDISFVDNMPAGMKVALPMNIDTSTCGGVVDVAADRQSFTYSGGYLAAGRRCTISIDATIRVNGNLVNTIPAEAVYSFTGITNDDPASSTLTNLPGVSVQKYFSPNRILAESDNYSILTIHLTNTSNASVPSMGLIDEFPAGLVIADVTGVSPTSTCGGTFTAIAGESTIQLTGGYLAGLNDPEDPLPSECDLTLPVTAEEIRAYLNVIEEGTVTSSAPNVTNPEPAQDTLEVYGTPDMQIVKSVTNPGSFEEGQNITYSIVVTNTGDISIHNVQVTDVGTGAVLGTCSPALGSTLAPGATMTCSATHTVTADDFTEGEYSNTAFADSDETDPVSDTEVVPLDGGPGMSINKTVVTYGPYELDDEIEFAITVNNVGAIILNNVQVSDLTAGVTLGTCTPVNGSSINPGESMVCSASYTIVQTDIDAGSFTNVAQADSDETDPETDSVTVQTASFPGLAVYKYEMSSGPYEVGDRVTFDIVTYNTGNTKLTGVTVIDTGTEVGLGPCTINEDPVAIVLPAELQVGDILYCEAYHDVTQADIDAGVYTNTATADSTETDPDTATENVQMIQIPMIDLVKVGTLDMTTVDPVSQADAGDTVTYAFSVTNTGNVTLYDITISDTLNGLVINGGPISSLAPGATDTTTFTGTYSLKVADIDSGGLTNHATVYAKDPNKATITDSDDDEISLSAFPSISLVKVGTLKLDIVSPDDRADKDDQIEYTFTVTNTGNVTLSNITISDPQVTVSGGTLASLAPGASDSTTFTGTYTLTQADINSGTFTNTASVSGTDPNDTVVNNSDDDTQTLPPVPSIEIEKTGSVVRNIVEPDDRIDAGDTITYTFAITNTGNVTLTNIQVSDLATGVAVSGNPIASLDPGETDSTTITGTYTITQADLDLGDRDNSASVTGTDPFSTQVSDTDDCTVPLEDEPEIALVKVGVIDDTVVDPSGVVNPGDQVNYTFTITNTGNVTLDTISIVDLMSDVSLLGSTITELVPGASDTLTYTASYSLTQADIDAGSFTNEAEVHGFAPDEEEIVDDASDTVEITQVPAIDLQKIGTIVDDLVEPAGVVNAGDEIRYVFRVENTGNVTLTDIEITDDMPDVTLTNCTITELAVGEVNENCTGVYVLTQQDLDLGEYANSADVIGQSPEDKAEVHDEDIEVTTLDPTPILGVSKDIIDGPIEVSTGVWQVTYEIQITNMGNVTIHDITVEDDLAAVFPDPNEFTVLDVISNDFDLNWPGYDGIPDPAGSSELLVDTGNILAPGESGALQILVELIPVNGGPFENSAYAYGLTPKDVDVQDQSQDGDNPDPDDDDQPGNNGDPTVIDFGDNMFNPPIGGKEYSNSGLPILDWSVTWINSSNIRPIYVRMSDPIPSGTSFAASGDPSGYPLPTGDLPEGTTTVGVACTVGGDSSTTTTTTTYCYYEGPTTEYPRGRIIWEGELGADYGLTKIEDAQNEILITYRTKVKNSTSEVKNVAWLGVDLDGSGVIEASEEEIVKASDTWYIEELPQTGFAPGVVTEITGQPATAENQSTGMWLSVPELNVYTYITTIPFEAGTWDVTWLNQQVGYLEGSAYPTWAGNTVLTAHNVTAFGEDGPFVDLDSLSYGDQIIIYAYGMTYTYEVRESLVILDENVHAAFQEEDYDWITLMTCTGYSEIRGEYSFRQLVRAVLISVTN